MPAEHLEPWEHPEVKLASTAQYVAGYVVSIALLGASLLLVTMHFLSPLMTISIISVFALVTVAAQLIFLFHLDFSKTQRWNSLTLMLNVPLLILSVGLTSWMFRELYVHVMAPGPLSP